MAHSRTDEEIIAALKKSRGMVAVAAETLGVTRRTLYNRLQKSEAIQEALEDAREFTTDVTEIKLIEAINRGEAWAVCFYLKCMGKARGYVERSVVEHETPAGGFPVAVTVTRRIVRPGDRDQAEEEYDRRRVEAFQEEEASG